MLAEPGSGSSSAAPASISARWTSPSRSRRGARLCLAMRAGEASSPAAVRRCHCCSLRPRCDVLRQKQSLTSSAIQSSTAAGAAVFTGLTTAPVESVTGTSSGPARPEVARRNPSRKRSKKSASNTDRGPTTTSLRRGVSLSTLVTLVSLKRTASASPVSAKPTRASDTRGLEGITVMKPPCLTRATKAVQRQAGASVSCIQYRKPRGRAAGASATKATTSSDLKARAAWAAIAAVPQASASLREAKAWLTEPGSGRSSSKMLSP